MPVSILVATYIFNSKYFIVHNCFETLILRKEKIFFWGNFYYSYKKRINWHSNKEGNNNNK